MVLVYIFDFIITFHPKNVIQKFIKKNTFSRMEISIKQFWKFVFNSKIVQNSIFTFIPFSCNISTHLFCIEAISFLRVSNEISFQYCLMQDFKVSLSSNWRLFLYSSWQNSPQIFIGFKSRDLVGLSKTSIFFCFKPDFRERCPVEKWHYWCLDDS